ncbi:hypothetical protein [Opitutus terrae]|uniref:hypothetical protein n=1 Tax=Opitutus terrae TaxID=107709 RepID=UPI0011D099EE|nr:hypothetical protein [Opitutus terrae]
MIAAERSGEPRDTVARAGFRVCGKLRLPLSTLAGAVGFRSLLSRAWVLAKAEAPWLAEVQIKSDGELQWSTEKEAALSTEEAARAATALVGQLLQLLVTFIGETLTRRLVQEIWPEAALDEVNPRENSHEEKS